LLKPGIFHDILFAMKKGGRVRAIRLIIFCLLAAGANYFLCTLAREVFHLPLFLDTVYTCALAFAAGVWPGISAAALTTLTASFHEPPIRWLFVLCSSAEVLLICASRRRIFKGISAPAGEQAPLSFISVFAALLLLSVMACAVVSVLGGFVDFFIQGIAGRTKFDSSPEDFFKMGLLRGGAPLLVADILSRIPINIVDRFITIFGGYMLSRFIRKAL
jgi:hypothetical protein